MPAMAGMSDVAVLGAGGVGGLIAAALTRAGLGVTVVAREPTAELIAAGGLKVASVALGDFQARPRAVPVLDEPADALIVATKATGLDAALDRVHSTPALVVPLLNGVEHLAALRDRFGADRVVAAVIRVQSDRPRTGRVVQSGPSVRVDVAQPPPSLALPTRQLADALSATGMEVRTGDGEARVMWGKLARLCPLALLTSAYDSPLGPLRDDPARHAALHRAIEEVVAVANAEGADLDVAGPASELDAAQPQLDSSMRRDIAAGRATEVDAIAGAVMRAAARHGLRCPTVASLAEAVAARELASAQSR